MAHNESAPVHKTTMRFGDDLWAEIEQAARAEGYQRVAPWIREAIMFRLGYLHGRRGLNPGAEKIDPPDNGEEHHGDPGQGA